MKWKNPGFTGRGDGGRARADRQAQELSCQGRKAYVVSHHGEFSAVLAANYPPTRGMIPTIVGVWREGVEQSLYRVDDASYREAVQRIHERKE